MPDVGCAGLLVEDTFCGPVSALPPPGALMVIDAAPVRPGGCAANVAIDLARQGVSADVLGCVGDDVAADQLIAAIGRHGVGTSRVVRDSRHATSKTIILLIEGEDRRYFHVPGANAALQVAQISREWLNELRVFYLGGLFALPGIDPRGLADLLAGCRHKHIQTVVDVVVPQDHAGAEVLKILLPHIDVFLPNEDEARVITGLTNPLDQVRALRSAGANTVVITCGAGGSVAMEADRVWSCGAFQMDVVDPSGSGDAFASGVVRSLLMGWDMPQTLRYASAVGASATRATGTTDTVFSDREAEAFLSMHPIRVIHED